MNKQTTNGRTGKHYFKKVLTASLASGLLFATPAKANIFEWITDQAHQGMSYVQATAQSMANTTTKLAHGDIDGAVNDFIERTQGGYPFMDMINDSINKLPRNDLTNAARVATDVAKRIDQGIAGTRRDLYQQTYDTYKGDYKELRRRIEQGDLDISEYKKYSLWHGIANANWNDPKGSIEQIATHQYELFSWVSNHKPGKLGAIKLGAQRAMKDEAIQQMLNEVKDQLKGSGVDAKVGGIIVSKLAERAMEERRAIERVCPSDFARFTPMKNGRFGPFEIRDLKYDVAIVAGYTHNNHQIYHYHPLREHKNNGYWEFIPTGGTDGLYYLRNNKHGGYLGAGAYTHDNHLYHYDETFADYKVFEVLRIFDQNETYKVVGYVLRDQKYLLGPVPGAAYQDGHVYHQSVKPVTRTEQLWDLYLCDQCRDGDERSQRRFPW